MLKTIRHFLELIRFSHTLFALPFALLAAVMAWRLQRSSCMTLDVATRLAIDIDTTVDRHRDYSTADGHCTFRWQELVGILLCMVTARSFAMAFNRLADRQHRRRQSAHRRPTFARRHSQRRRK